MSPIDFVSKIQGTGFDWRAAYVSVNGDAIGLIDTGIDILHEAFRDSNGNSRIHCVWKQRMEPVNGQTKSQKDSLPGVYTQTYGTHFDAQAIQSMIAGSVPVPMALRDPQNHGTHVCSIAAALSNTTDNNAVVAISGTGMVAPHVAGSIALALSMRVKSERPQINANRLGSILKRTTQATNGAHHPEFAFGSLDTERFHNKVRRIP